MRSERVGGQGAAAVRCQPVLGEAPGEESLCTETGADRTPGMTQSGGKAAEADCRVLLKPLALFVGNWLFWGWSVSPAGCFGVACSTAIEAPTRCVPSDIGRSRVQLRNYLQAQGNLLAMMALYLPSFPGELSASLMVGRSCPENAGKDSGGV